MQRHLFLFLLICLCALRSGAVIISGDVSDAVSRSPLSYVAVVNVHTNESVGTDSSGRFMINVEKGQLLEFRKLGYKVLRVRIPSGTIPPYFKLFMHEGPVELPEYDLIARGRDFKKDSLRYYELYRTYLNMPELKGLDVIRHPFSALSKRNRMIWAFQKEFALFEQEKFIDYTFNEKLIEQLTGLKDDSARAYMRAYRPTYEQLRSMSDYGFYSYIKQTVTNFRARARSNRRSAN